MKQVLPLHRLPNPRPRILQAGEILAREVRLPGPAPHALVLRCLPGI